MLDTIIIDDSLDARKILEYYCEKNAHINLCQSCDSAQAGLDYLAKNKADLVLLDMEMPGMSGIDFLNRAPVLPMVVFTTSESKYAVHAFEFEAQDFLHKPFNYPRFASCIDKISTAESKEKPAPVTDTKNIFIKEKGRLTRVATADIMYFENAGDYVRVFTEDKEYLTYGTLKSIVGKLPANRFLRIHRSFIINLQKIVDIEENTLVIARKVIPIGKAHKAKLMRHLKMI